MPRFPDEEYYAEQLLMLGDYSTLPDCCRLAVRRAVTDRKDKTMTNVISFIGSPRKTGNTAALVKAFADGAAGAGAETATVLLNTLNMHGCQSCYLCKSSGVCAVKDDMTPLYEQLAQADVVVFASPIYMGTVTAQCKLLLDRLYAYMKTDLQQPAGAGENSGRADCPG